jgi:arylsulfatase A-like enzyme
MPTVLDLLGVEGSDRLQGHSLSPLLEGKSRSAPRPIVSGFHKGWRTALVGSHKLIQRTWQNPALYDLGEDPGETEDLQQDRPVTLRYLRGMLGLALAGHEDAEAPTRNRARARKQKSPRDHEPEETDIDPETKEQLRALGYVH